jgi:REP-associated tyrosine transposase
MSNVIPGSPMKALPKRKKIRLAPEAYRNSSSTFNITIDANKGQEFFNDHAFNDHVVFLLRTLAERDGVRIKIYCLMPTHLHLLIQPGRRSLVDCIADFKKVSAAAARRMRRIENLWQRSFFDHRLRSNESEIEQLEYIRMNPVQAGLVEHPDTWPWTGSVNVS